MKRRNILVQLLVFIIFAAPVFGQIRRTDKTADLQTPSSTSSMQKMDSLQNQVNNFADIRLCIDQQPKVKIPDKPVYKPPQLLPKLSGNGELRYPNTLQQPLTSLTILMWNPGDEITVGFYPNQTNDFVIRKVKQFAKEWEAIANIKFSFVEDVNAATIKCGFEKGKGNWSWLGRMVTGNFLKLPTMNYAFFDNNTSDAEFRSNVLHEFGHALGFVHEHQAPTAGISWNKEKVYAYFTGAPNYWSRAQVDLNIFYKYSSAITNFSRYDRSSIMHYYFPSDLTTDGSFYPLNTNFSPIDIQYAASVYPFPPRLTGSKGTLQTGDDCDAIDFNLEFLGLDSNFIEFIFQPGVDPWGEKVTWWKQIGIPMKGGVETPIQLRTDGRSELVRLPVNMIDFTRPISFSKAKALGIRTLLGFKWNALPAIKGGCRLTLTWKQDRCQKIF